MPKTLVCILEEETILNYLFIKEMYVVGDKVLLISQQSFASLVARFRTLFPTVSLEAIVLAKDGDEDLWDTICRTIRAGLSAGEEYAVNLSSGTRLMSIAVQQVFERFNSQFYFMPHDRNVIVHSQIDDNNDNNDDEVVAIKHRVSVEEYLIINDIASSPGTVAQSKEYAQHFLALFTGNMLSNGDHQMLDTLRNTDKKFLRYDALEGLERFIRYIGFPAQSTEGLSRSEMRYLAGGWFEEYVYYAVQEAINPDSIATGVVIQRNENHNNDRNELDVVFTFRNRLFVVECKTGVGKNALYHQIVYKACALKEALLGMRSNAYIFSLNEDPKGRLDQTARNMGITFCGKEFAERPTKLTNLFQNPKLWL